jgi:hypothetical protein
MKDSILLLFVIVGELWGRTRSFPLPPFRCRQRATKDHRRHGLLVSSSSSSSSSGPDLTLLENIILPDNEEEDGDDDWKFQLKYNPYITDALSLQEWKEFIVEAHDAGLDPLWEQIKLEATVALGPEPEAGPQVYQGILSQSSLLEAIVTVIAHEIETELVQATEIKELMLEALTFHGQDEEIMAEIIRSDVRATATRSGSVGNALTAVLFHIGLHALVCYRVGHILWNEDRKGLAYYLQSTVSRKYSADIHPAARLGNAQYLSSTAGVVIGETATTGDDCSILPG